jgi:Flp pilus assembly protein TadB
MSDEKSPGIGEQARALRDDLAPAKLERKLEEVIEERPKAGHLLDFEVVGKALLAAVVLALLVWLLIGPRLAAIVLVVGFLGAWFGLAQMSYDRRRPTKDTREPDIARDSEDDPDEEPSASRNGSSPDRKPAADRD